MKLLLVDDDSDQLELRCLTLAKAGYRICSAANVQAALRLAAEETPDVAVIDLNVPTEDAGLRLIRGLKKLDADMRLIVLTGTDAKRLEQLPERASVEAVFTKGNASRQLMAYLVRTKLVAEGQLVIEAKVIPRSSKNEIVEILADGSVKVKLAAAPEKGKANEQLVALLAEYFGVRKDAVELIGGETSQRKRLRIRNAKAT